MSLKPLVFTCSVFAGLLLSAAPAPAQEWWNPVSWFSPSRTYAARPMYGASCPNGNCYPTSYGYQRGYVTSGYAPLSPGVAACPGGNCTQGSCAKGNCGASVMPYRATSPNAPVGSNLQLVPTGSAGRSRPNPFYQ